MIMPTIGDPANTVGLSSEEDDKRYFRSLPQGYRFRPKDSELVVKYLKREVDKTKPLPRNNIRRIDIYKHTPHQLCQRDEDYRENEWYFFSPRDRKYPKGSRPRRQAAGGFWKPTGIDKAVVHKGSVVGYKKSLDFYEGHVQKNPKRTHWKMHEYRILHRPQPLTKTNNTAPPNNIMELDTVLCKIYRKTNGKEDKNDDIDHQNTLHFNNEQQQPLPPPQQQLQTVADPYNSDGGARAQSLAIDIPTFLTTDTFVIHENGGQEDGTLQNSVQSAGEDYYYRPSRPVMMRYEGFDELSSMFR